MNRSLGFFLILASFIFTEFFLYSKPVYAQPFRPSVGISILLKNSATDEAKPGLIVGKDPNGYYITSSYKDPNVAGVITDTTDFLYTLDSDENRITIAVEGAIRTWVSNEYGAVNAGDFLTTSSQPGIAAKAIENGPIIGYALEALQESDEPQLIDVQLSLNDDWRGSTEEEGILKKSGNVIDRIITNVQSEASKTSRSFLYIVVIIVILIASIFGFLIFGRIAVNGILAIGRNPLAQKTIMKSVIINAAMTIIFTLASILIALYLIR